MESHAVVAIAVQHAQHGIEGDLGALPDRIPDLEKSGRPGLGNAVHTRIAIHGAGISVVGGQPRGQKRLAEETDLFQLPVDLSPQGIEIAGAILRREIPGHIPDSVDSCPVIFRSQLHSASGKPVQPLTGLARHLADGVGAQRAERVVDGCAGVGPGAVRMRVIAGPHQVVRPHQCDQRRTEGFLLEGGVDLAVEELARTGVDAFIRIGQAVLLELVVHARDEVRKPPHP